MNEAEIRRIFAKPKKRTNHQRRVTLKPRQRAEVRAKTAGTCHVCGGFLGKGWQADHVVPRQFGGTNSLDNYLAICRECNRLRWGYPPAMLRLIIRFGIFAKQEIRHETELGQDLVRLAVRRYKQTKKRRERSSKASASHRE